MLEGAARRGPFSKGRYPPALSGKGPSVVLYAEIAVRKPESPILNSVQLTQGRNFGCSVTQL